MMVAAGDPVYAEDINERGIVYQGNRSTTITGVTTEAGVLRIDNMVLKAGYAYEFKTGNVRPTLTVASDRVAVRLRYNSAGTATTSSVEIGRSEWQTSVQGTGSGAGSGNLVSCNIAQPTGWVIPPTTTTAASILLCLLRASGTGSAGLPPDVGGTWLTVICHGPAVSDTGIDI